MDDKHVADHVDGKEDVESNELGSDLARCEQVLRVHN